MRAAICAARVAALVARQGEPRRQFGEAETPVPRPATGFTSVVDRRRRAPGGRQARFPTGAAGRAIRIALLRVDVRTGEPPPPWPRGRAARTPPYGARYPAR